MDNNTNHLEQQKKFMTFDEQIDYLKNEKHLIIPDEKYAREMLKQTCYHSLIVGYKNIFKDEKTGFYKEGTTFNDIVNLYHFDEDLRALLLEYFFRVEDQIRSLVSYYFCEKHGESQSKYLDVNNYNVTRQNKHEVESMIHIFSNIANKSTDNEAIVHARTKHKNVPLWILVTTLTFGNIYKLFSFLTPDIKQKIVSSYPHLKADELESLLAVTNKFRNVCAHRERLFTYHAAISVPDLPVHDRLNIPFTEEGTYMYGKNGLYSVVIALYYLLSEASFSEFKSALSKLLNIYLHKEKVYPEAEFLDILGFPSNWYEI